MVAENCSSVNDVGFLYRAQAYCRRFPFSIHGTTIYMSPVSTTSPATPKNLMIFLCVKARQRRDSRMNDCARIFATLPHYLTTKLTHLLLLIVRIILVAPSPLAYRLQRNQRTRIRSLIYVPKAAGILSALIGAYNTRQNQGPRKYVMRLGNPQCESQQLVAIRSKSGNTCGEW